MPKRERNQRRNMFVFFNYEKGKSFFKFDYINPTYYENMFFIITTIIFSVANLHPKNSEQP